ncbi:MAG: cytochrome P450 [Proteobacteria bacterium]|nr:cytochrome P450 [Pseudomonadota bacterium]
MSVVVSTRKTIADLDGPNGLPIVGNLLQVNFEQFHLHVERWCDEFGPIFKIRMGPKTIVCIADSDEVNKLLRDRPATYRRRSTIESVIKELGFNGVFSSEGEDWKRQRKVVALALNSAHLNQFFPQLLETTRRLQRRWEKAADQNLSVDLCRDVMRYTVDVTTQLAFGVSVNTLETDGPVIQQQLDKVFPMLGKRVNAPFPYWRYIRLPKDRELDRAIAGIETTVNGFITDCRQRMQENPSLYDEPTNFLEAIIAAQTAEQGSKFTDQEIYSNVVTLLLAGEDTTANTIAWAGKYFIEFPDYFAKVRAEVDSIVGSDSLVSDHNLLPRLKYLEAFANETMRIKPVGPLFPMETNEPVNLMGYELPAKTPVLALTRHLAINPENFGAPDQFNPERWLNPQSSATAPHKTNAFLPFGTGPRFCPGRNLALVEIKMALAMLCRNFQIELTDPTRKVEEKLAFAMFPANLKVKFTRRQ